MYNNFPSWFTRCFGGKGRVAILAMTAPTELFTSLALRRAASSSKVVFPSISRSFCFSLTLSFGAYSSWIQVYFGYARVGVPVPYHEADAHLS